MTSVLTIGNSFADNATLYLDDLALAGAADLLVGKMNLGGCSLEKHWNLVRQCDLLPEVKPYALRITGRPAQAASLREALTMHAWDYVTLQQVSNLSWQKETYYPYINYLYQLVRELAPQAQPVIHQTWAYRCDAPSLRQWGISEEQMFTQLKEAYDEAATKLACPILPSGAAIQKARAIFKFVPDTTFNYAQPVPLQLPEQSKSLSVGYFWRTGNTSSGNAELHMDERHANAKGCYLANAIWYEMFTRKSITQNPFCPTGISSEELSILQQVARETVNEYGGALR